MAEIKVRLYATCAIRVPLDTEIDLDEFGEWHEESAGGFDPKVIEPHLVVEFINASPDDETEYARQFPDPDVNTHEILSFDIDDAEILPEPEEGPSE